MTESLRMNGRLARIIVALKPRYVVAILLLTFILAVVYMAPANRSFLVDARTLGVRLVFLDNASMNTWRIAPGAYVCRVAGGDEPLSGTVRHTLCPTQEFEVELLEDSISFTWPKDATLEIIATPGGELAVFIEGLGEGESFELGNNLKPLGLDSVIVLPARTFSQSGSLPFSAVVQIGAEASAGARNILISGEYAIREQLLGRSGLISVATGLFHRGDQISFAREIDGAPVVVFGFLSSGIPLEILDHQAPFHIVAYSEKALSEMRVDRFGTLKSVVVSDWTQRAVNDPLLIGGTVLLTLISLLISVLSSLVRSADEAQALSSSKNSELQDSRDPAADLDMVSTDNDLNS